MKFKRPSASIVLMLSLALGMFLYNAQHAHSVATPGVTITDNGMFVVPNSLPANFSTVPNPLVAGHWGDSFNVTISDSLPHLVTWRLAVNATTVFITNSTLDQPFQVVYLDLGSSQLDSFELFWSVQ